MSGEALYERYKDALKRGHVASLRGRLDEALDAYAEASSDRARAPDAPRERRHRAPAAQAAGRRAALLRGRAAPGAAGRDGAAGPGPVAGRARPPARMRPTPSTRSPRSARPTAGWPTRWTRPVAAWSWPRAGERRRTLERLIERLRASEPGEPGRLALERALLVLDGPAAARRPSEAWIAGGEPVAAACRPDPGRSRARGLAEPGAGGRVGASGPSRRHRGARRARPGRCPPTCPRRAGTARGGRRGRRRTRRAPSSACSTWPPPTAARARWTPPSTPATERSRWTRTTWGCTSRSSQLYERARLDQRWPRRSWTCSTGWSPSTMTPRAPPGWLAARAATPEPGGRGPSRPGGGERSAGWPDARLTGRCSRSSSRSSGRSR